MDALIKAETQRGGASPRQQTGLTSNLIPEAKVSNKEMGSSQTGVTPKNVPSKKKANEEQSDDKLPHWYVLRATYGREKYAYESILKMGGTAFYATMVTTKLIDGRRRTVEESRIPNILFVYGTKEDVKSYKNKVTTGKKEHKSTFLRFYCGYNKDSQRNTTPLIVPDKQMESFRKICLSKGNDIIITSRKITKFKEGQLVKVTSGPFEGLIGHVAHYKNQLRVGVVIDGLLSAISSYIPRGMMEVIQ